jgi:hypothetical protein
MNTIQIKRPSKKVLAKMRKGGKCRICGCGSEGGIPLMIHPSRMNTITKSFTKGKGLQMSLSPDEIVANQGIKGKGIFGEFGDDALKWIGETTGVGGERFKDMAYQAGDIIKPFVKKGIDAGIASGSTALAAFAPELAPFIPAGAAALSSLSGSYLDDPSQYGVGQRGRRQEGGIPAPVKEAGRQLMNVGKEEGLKRLSEYTGQKLGNLSQAAIGKALHDATAAQLEAALQQRRLNPDFLDIDYDGIIGNGLYGKGLYASNAPRSRGGGGGNAQQQIEDYLSRLGNAVIGRGGAVQQPRSRMVGSGEFSDFIDTTGDKIKHAFGGKLSQKRELFGSMGARGQPVGYVKQAPAMRSQPYASNFQFSSTLPPALQRFSRG